MKNSVTCRRIYTGVALAITALHRPKAYVSPAAIEDKEDKWCPENWDRLKKQLCVLSNKEIDNKSPKQSC
jgi:hypothetical protein